MNKKASIILIACSLSLSACIRPFQPDVQQGNIINNSDLRNRNQRKKETDQRLITAVFNGDELIELKGDVDLSNVQNLEPSTEDRQHGGTVITEPTQKEKGLFNRLGLFKKKDKAAILKRKRDKKKEKERKRREKENAAKTAHDYTNLSHQAFR